jgi:hypothetical protein
MKIIKGLERLKNTVNKYMADLQPTSQNGKLVISRRPDIYIYLEKWYFWK